MNKTILFLLLFFPVVINAQVRLGFRINQIQNAFGLGLDAGVPVAGNALLIRVAGTHQWLEAPVENGWGRFGYQTLRAGLSGGRLRTGSVRFYGEGGAMLLFSSDIPGAPDTRFGGYGVFVFEFETGPAHMPLLFIEIGGTSAGLTDASEYPHPSFGAGLLLGAGLRMALGKAK